MNFADQISKLNPKQREAVDTIDGPVLVVAGPGTGKTQVLATRIANILDKTDQFAQNILCITFTEAGVKAMRDRLSGIIGKDAHLINVNTFHGFCNEVIQDNPGKFPQFGGRPTQLNDLLKVKLMQRILDELDAEKTWHLRPFHYRYQYQYEIGSAIQNLKREGVTPAEFKVMADKELAEINANPSINKKTGKPTQQYLRDQRSKERNVELAEIYSEYQRHLEEENMYDYEDMIMAVVEGFEQDKELLADYLEKYQYVLVDEYQDTNGSQNQLISLLGTNIENSPNIFAVGDDDQAIFRFQGANVDNVLFFNQQFDGVRTISIDINYRSNQAILDAASALIENNQNRLSNLIDGLDKSLTSGRDLLPTKPQTYQFTTGDQELEFITSQVADLIESGVNPEEVAIIYRRHSDADDLVEALARKGVAVNVRAGGNALDNFQVQRLLKLLKLIYYHGVDRDQLMFELLFYDFIQSRFEFSRLAVFKLIKYVSDYNYRNSQSTIEILELLLDEHRLQFIDLGDEAQKLHALANAIIGWRELASNTNLAQFVAELMQDSGMLQQLFADELDIAEINAVNSVYSFVKDLTRQDREMSLRDLLSNLELLAENSLSISEKQVDTSEVGVQLMTAHGAKGLEFEYVFMFKTVDNAWGGRPRAQIIKLPEQLTNLAKVDSDEKELKIEDERRLFFVAMTRAKRRLTITAADSYMKNGQITELAPSRFIAEIPSELVQQGSISDYEELDLNLVRASMSPISIAGLEAKEKAYLKTLVKDFRLSASALNEYLECPIKFKFNRLLKVPIPYSRELALGNAVHAAMEKLNLALKLQDQPEADIESTKPSLELLQTTFSAALSSQQIGGDDYQDALVQGREILERYWEEYSTKLIKPAAVEYYVRSVPLEVEGMAPIILTGKIDKLEWIDESENLVRVVDYKTSKPKSENQIKGLTKNGDKNIWRQLVFYQLLAELDPNFRPPNKMNKYKVVEVQVDFLKEANGSLKRMTFEVTPSDIEELKQEIIQVMTKIRGLDFYNTEDYPKCSEWELGQFLS